VSAVPRTTPSRYEQQLEQNTVRDTARLARELQINALREEWRAYVEGQPTEEQLSTDHIRSAAYRGALVRCLRIANGETGAGDRAQVKACEAIFKLSVDEARLAAEMRGDTTPQPQITAQLSAAAIPPQVLEQFGEQLTEVLQQRRKLAARGG